MAQGPAEKRRQEVEQSAQALFAEMQGEQGGAKDETAAAVLLVGQALVRELELLRHDLRTLMGVIQRRG